jgi:histidyl-tRNA synthetase
LRILDSKDPGDIQINADAPTFHNFLNDTSRNFFLDVRAGLDRLEIKYAMNPHLVRGLDYYTHTVFEFVTTDLGAQGTVLAGGRYDGLVELMGGPSMPGVGWAAGIERLAMLIDEPPAPARPVALVPISSDHAEAMAVMIAEELRDAGLVVDVAYSGNLQRRMRRADRIGARAAVLLGEDELAQGGATVRDLDSGAQELVPLADLAARLKTMAG